MNIVEQSEFRLDEDELKRVLRIPRRRGRVLSVVVVESSSNPYDKRVTGLTITARVRSRHRRLP